MIQAHLYWGVISLILIVVMIILEIAVDFRVLYKYHKREILGDIILEQSTGILSDLLWDIALFLFLISGVIDLWRDFNLVNILFIILVVLLLLSSITKDLFIKVELRELGIYTLYKRYTWEDIMYYELMDYRFENEFYEGNKSLLSLWVKKNTRKKPRIQFDIDNNDIDRLVNLFELKDIGVRNENNK